MLPYGRISIRVAQPREVVLERLRQACMAASWPPFGHDPKFPFVGSVDEDIFSVSLNIRGQNSFLPFLEGTVAPTGNGQCVVTCRMTPHPVIAYMLFAGVCVTAVNASTGWH